DVARGSGRDGALHRAPPGGDEARRRRGRRRRGDAHPVSGDAGRGTSRGAVDRVWYGDDAVARAARALLWPVGRLFAAVSATRNVMYDRGLLRSVQPDLPSVSVGNLTVGGTGK